MSNLEKLTCPPAHMPPTMHTPTMHPPSPHTCPPATQPPPCHAHPLVNRITGRCKNITFPQLRLRTVKMELVRYFGNLGICPYNFHENLVCIGLVHSE